MSERGRCVVWFVLGIALLEGAWILVLPPFRGSDEIDHVYRAAAVAHGQWVATDVPEEARGLLVEVPEDLVGAARPECESLASGTPEQCVGSQLPSRPGFRSVSSGAANYHPVYYALVGVAARSFNGIGAVYAMRAASVLLCLVLLGLAVLHAQAQGRWSVLAMVATTLPTMTYSMAVTAPNGPEMAAAAAWWCGLLTLARGSQPRPGATLAVAGAGALLCFLRLLGPLFVAVSAVTVVLARWSLRDVARPGVLVDLLRGWRARLLVGGVVVGMALVAWWSLEAQPYAPARSPEGPQEMGFAHLVLWAFQSIGAFPYRDQMASPPTYVLVGTILGLLVVLGVLRARGRLRVALIGVLLASVLLPVALTLATLDSTGNIWQGRYGWPLSMGCLVLAGASLDGSSSRLGAPWAVVAVWVLTAGQLAALLGVLAGEASRSSSELAPGWQPAPWWILVMACVAAAAALSQAVRVTRG